MLSVCHYFLWLNCIPLYDNILFFCSSVDGHLGYFHFWTRNNAAMNIHVQIFMWTCFHFSRVYIPSSGLAGLFANSMFNFEEMLDCFQRGCSILQSTNNAFFLFFFFLIFWYRLNPGTLYH